MEWLFLLFFDCLIKACAYSVVIEHKDYHILDLNPVREENTYWIVIVLIFVVNEFINLI